MCTAVSSEELKAIEKKLQSEKTNPRDLKMQLAFEVTKIYHGEKMAIKAQEDFVNKFQKKNEEVDASLLKVEEGDNVIDVLAGNGLAQSKSDARRKIKQGGVSIDGKKITLEDDVSKDWDGKILKVGKKDFRKLKIK
jgi:tyrosyl-tRNA synthetase